MTPAAAAILLAVAAPFAFMAAWSDLRSMIISNRLVVALALSFLVVGPWVLPWADYGLRVGVGLVALVVGFFANVAGLVGGGDAKYLAALLPFVAPGDLTEFLLILAVMTLAAWAAHRLVQRIPPIRNLEPEWVSWHAGKQFPYGLALSGALVAYLGAELALSLG